MASQYVIIEYFIMYLILLYKRQIERLNEEIS